MTEVGTNDGPVWVGYSRTHRAASGDKRTFDTVRHLDDN